MKVWSEKNGRADIVVYGWNVRDTVFSCIAGLIVVCASIVVLGGLA